MYEYMNMNMTIFHGLGMLVFWGIIVFVIVSLVKSNQREHKDTPIDI